MGAGGLAGARRLAVALALVCVLAPATVAGAAEQPCTTAAEPAHRPSPRVVAGSVDGVKFNALLPADYASSGRRYPVLYLLHGGFYNQDTWLNHSDIERFTAPFTGSRGVIVVMPSGDGTGLFVDWHNGAHHWDTFFTRRLIPHVDAHFRTLADRSHRAIAGFSLGGFSVLHLAGHHPDLFVAAGGFSALADITYRSPALELALYPAAQDYNPQCGQYPDFDGPFGDPVTDDVWWHDSSPPDLAPNYRGMELYLASGDGTPCSADDVTHPGTLFPYLESAILAVTRSFDAALRAAGVAHTTDLYGCGTHDWPYWRRDLRRFWPLMTRAFGRPDPASFDHRRATPRMSAWGWSTVADPDRAAEFLTLSSASRRGVTLTGSGRTLVTTAPYYRPRRRIRVIGAGGAPATVVVGTDRRISFRVDLGEPNSDQQYTLGSESAPRRFATRRISFVGVPRERPRHRRRHRAGR